MCLKKGVIEGSEINEQHERDVIEYNKRVTLEYVFYLLKKYGIIPEDTELIIREI